MFIDTARCVLVLYYVHNRGAVYNILKPPPLRCHQGMCSVVEVVEHVRTIINRLEVMYQ